MRSLRLEPLEERQLLAGTPWQNPVFRLDVNNNSVTTPADALVIINRFIANNNQNEDLPDPGGTPPPHYVDTNGDNKMTPQDLLAVINGILSPPQVLTTSLTPYTIDVTPQITVTADGSPAIADDSILDLDIDLNSDGDFTDPGELGHTQSTFFNGSSTFQITPALERTSELYSVKLRARVKNSEGVVGSSPSLTLGVDTLTSNALANYVNTFDPSYTWSLQSSTAGPGFTYHVLGMTSQTWRSEADVNKPVWHHWLQIYVPTGTIKNTALLLIDGGSNTSAPDAAVAELGNLAIGLQTVVIDLKGIPSEPVIFTDESQTRSEDAIIAYTFDKFIEHLDEPGNETWPLLLPMVKSAVRAMDTVQTFIPTVKPGSVIDDFLVTGYSKRGWTTWLTAAVDDRVRAIIPGVFDNLNQAPQMVHHYGVYGFFSEAVDDYEDLDIFTRLLTAESQRLSPITDPYRYLSNGRFENMPKLIINSPGDEFFVTDSAQFYIHDIPGQENHLRYIPNTGHGLDLDEVIASTVGFYDAVVNGRALPNYSWTVEQNGAIRVQTVTTPTKVLLWQATNINERDFRNFAHPEITWTSTTLSNQGGGVYVGNVAIPDDGATGYFVEMTFDNPVPLLPDYVFTTEARVKSPLAFAPWPFIVEPPEGGLALAAATSASSKQLTAIAAHDSTRNAAAVALAHDTDALDPFDALLPESLLLPEVEEPRTLAIATQSGLMLSEEPTAELLLETEAETADALIGAERAGLSS